MREKQDILKLRKEEKIFQNHCTCIGHSQHNAIWNVLKIKQATDVLTTRNGTGQKGKQFNRILVRAEKKHPKTKVNDTTNNITWHHNPLFKEDLEHKYRQNKMETINQQ